ncbi:MAG: hypothetical protein ACM3JJ_12715 [Hyphomicrobiales bacterium]
MAPNESLGWIWIVAGVLSGLGLGLGFQRDDFLGGYGSHRRRLLRLGHISFLGLGFLNLFFALSAARMRLPPAGLATASWAIVAGAVTMPLCCGLMAWRRGFHLLFGVPVVSVLVGTALAAWGLVRP